MSTHIKVHSRVLERRRMLHEETLHHAEDLKKEADEREKMWKEKKDHEVVAWREKIHREQDTWQHHMQHQMKACHKEHQKHMEEVLHNSYLPKCAKTGSSQKWVLSSSTDFHQPHYGHHQFGKKSREALKPKKKSVRFQQNTSIHVIEENEPEFFENDASGPTQRDVDETPVTGGEADSLKSAEEDKESEKVGEVVGENDDGTQRRVSLESLKEVATGLAEMAIQNAKDELNNI